MTTQHTDEMREAFQSWAANYEHANVSCLRRYEDPDEYASLMTATAFDAYQAATASAEAKYLPVIEKLVDLVESGKGMIMCSKSEYERYHKKAGEALSSYDTPGSQGGEKSSVYHIPLYDADGKVTLQPVAYYPADEEEAPLSEAEIAAMADEWFVGNSPNPEDQAHCREFAKALAKRLGWMR